MVGWHHQLKGYEFEQALGNSEGQGSLACWSPRGCKESDTTQRLSRRETTFGPPPRASDVTQCENVMSLVSRFVSFCVFLAFQINRVRRAGKGDWLVARGQKPDQGRTQGFGPSRERLHSEVVRASRGPQW